MRREKKQWNRRKLYLFLFYAWLPLLALFTSFAFLQKASAIEVSVNVAPTGNTWTVGSDLRCTVNNDTTPVTVLPNGYGECNLPLYNSQTMVRNFYKNTPIDVVAGNFYSFIFGYENSDTGLANIIWNLNTNFTDWDIITFEKVTGDSIQDKMCNQWTYGSNSIWNCSAYSGLMSNWKANYYQVVLRAKATGSKTVILGNLDGHPGTLIATAGGQISMSSIFEYEVVSSDSVLNEIANNTESTAESSQATADALEQQNQQDQEDRSNMDNQQSDSQQSADQSQAQAEQTGTSLLAAFTSFVTSLGSASPSDCKIDMDLGNLDLGMVDYCQMSPPAIVQTIGSILLIAFCVPLSIATATKVITLFRSFQS